MTEGQIYPFKPGLGGIHTSELVPTKSDLITGGSGRKILYSLTSDKISFADAQNPYTHLIATLEKDGSLEFDLQEKFRRTILERCLFWHPERHPDFHSLNFVDFAIRYFTSHGNIPTSYIGHWGIGKNSETYYEFYEQYLQKSPDLIQAAKAVSIAEVIARYGFVITDKDIQLGSDDAGLYVEAIFHRSKPIDNLH